jgi:c-di-GMP-related signal transduction protein
VRWALVALLPSTITVVEVLETVPAHPDVVAACRSLNEAGYMIALDDDRADDRANDRANDPREALAEVADIIKVELQWTTRGAASGADPAIRAALPSAGGENRNPGGVCADSGPGVCVFPGYFFRRPEMMNTRDLPANRMNYLRMLPEVSRPELNLGGLEKLIKAEASVCHRLLRYLNSAIFGFKSEIHSVRACAVDPGRA